jgi:cytochrome c peroxidase
MKKSFSKIALLFTGAILASAGFIDTNQLFNYQAQPKPAYIQKDNTPSDNSLEDAVATIGRVLFYDKAMSLNNSLSCASCHQQAFAFSDTAVLSTGFEGGKTGRHSMRLVNSRFSNEGKFFWDERAGSLELQSTQPIKDHVEMGFSGTNGQPNMDSLVRKLMQLERYQKLSPWAFQGQALNESRIQKALAQFVRSIQSFDSKFDVGRAQANNDMQNFANFTADENAGKSLFMMGPPMGGAGCQRCHAAPEFSIDPASRNNGVIGVAGAPGEIDLTNTRAPSLRDLFNPSGTLNGPLMHNGVFTSLEQVIAHYNRVPAPPANTNLDQRLAGPGGNLQLNPNQQAQLVAFLKTLTGSDLYVNPKWSNPFDENNNLDIRGITLQIQKAQTQNNISCFPNPFTSQFEIVLPSNEKVRAVSLRNLKGQLLFSGQDPLVNSPAVAKLPPGFYLLEVVLQTQHSPLYLKIVKE